MFATDTRINKCTPDSHFHKLPNSISRNTELSTPAHRILVHLCSLPNDWRIYKDYVAHIINRAPRTAQRYLSELRDHGHIIYVNEHDDYGNFAGGHNVLYETPIEAANTAIVVRMDEKRKQQKAKENRARQLRERERVLAEIAEEQEQEKKVSDLNLHKLFRECFKRLKKVDKNINASDAEYLKLAFKAYLRTHEGKLYEHSVYDWMEKALQFRLQREYRTMKISAVKDERSNAVAANQQAQADYINAQTSQLKSCTPKTTAEKQTDTSWCDDLTFDVDTE